MPTMVFVHEALVVLTVHFCISDLEVLPETYSISNKLFFFFFFFTHVGTFTSEHWAYLLLLLETRK
jgi:hypothetical protein